MNFSVSENKMLPSDSMTTLSDIKMSDNEQIYLVEAGKDK